MAIKNISINTILTIAFLMNHHTWSMEKKPCLAIIPYTEFNLKTHIKKYNEEKYNEEYNINNSPLVALAPEMLEAVLTKIPSLDEAIKTALALRVTCKTFNELSLEYFGKAYKHHDKIKKYEILYNTLLDMNYDKYWNKRYKALILILAGAEDTSGYPLIDRIVSYDDKKAAAIYASSDQKDRCYRILNRASPEMIKIFIENGLDLNQKIGRLPNVLWDTIPHNPERIQFYLNNHVNATTINPFNGDCLLHLLAKTACDSGAIFLTINDYLETGSLLLIAAPHLVNHLNYRKQTPIGVIQQYCTDMLPKCPYPPKMLHTIKECLNKLILLFKKHGRKTTKQLEKKSKKQYLQLVYQIKNFSHHDYSRE